MTRCPELLTGKNSVCPWMIPSITASIWFNWFPLAVIYRYDDIIHIDCPIIKFLLLIYTRLSTRLMAIKDRFSINVLENADNEVLLLKRGTATELGPGRWGFPAGHIETGESPMQCSLRELEIGTDHTLELIGQIGPVNDTFYGGRYEIYLYHYRWQAGRVLLNHEHTAYAWVGREQYKNYAVMDGIDEDLLYFNVWPREYLNADKLPTERKPSGR